MVCQLRSAGNGQKGYSYMEIVLNIDSQELQYESQILVNSFLNGMSSSEERQQYEEKKIGIQILPEEVVGHTVVIHENRDDVQMQPAGNSGAKIACGEIKSNLQ